jgi:predicted nucleic acid-binding protein
MNASPVILLAKAEVIQFIPSVCDQLVIPAGAVDEVRRGKMSDAGRAWLERGGAKFISKPISIPPVLVSWDLGLGETQVLSYALANRGFKVVLDDLKARRCAEHLNLPLIGSLRVLLILKEQKLISAIRPAVDKFKEAGSYFSEPLIQQALQLAGET